MGRLMVKHKKPLEPCQGRYSAISHDLLDSVSFMDAGHTARSLLFDLIRQHTGQNNGHLQMAASWMKKRGWTSNVMYQAKLELIGRRLIIQTRQGGLNAGPNLYAVIWLQISSFRELDIDSKHYHPGKWRFMDTIPPIAKHKLNSVERTSPFPLHGVVEYAAAPAHSGKTALYVDEAASPRVNNIYTHTNFVSLPGGAKKPVLGAKGHSGKKFSFKMDAKP